MNETQLALRKCSNCSAIIEDEESVCASCGRKNEPDTDGTIPIVLLVVCILAIIGSILAILRGLFYQRLAMVFFDTDFSRGWIILFTGLGTLAGGVLMLRRRINGLYLFTAFQLVYIITVVSGFMSNSTHLEQEAQHLAGILTVVFFLIPAVVLLALSWNRRIKNQLS